MTRAQAPVSSPAAPAISQNRDGAMLHWVQQLAPYGIFTTDNELRIQTWNHWLEGHSGQSADSVVGRPLLEVFPDLLTRKLDHHYLEALEGRVNVLSTALHGHLLRFPTTMRDSPFPDMQQTVRIGPLLFNRIVCGTLTTIEDVTQREMQAQALRQHAEKLEEKVRERTRRLDETVAQLESFSYTVAHDLRAPVRTFQGFTEILLEDYGQDLPPPAQEYLDRMKRAAEGMDQLIRDLLQFNRVSRQQIEAEPIDLGEMVDEIVARTPSLQQAGVLTIQTPLLPVLGNRTLLQQSLSNLLDNAIKFVVPDRALRVGVRTELRPADTGPTGSNPLPPFNPPTALKVGEDTDASLLLNTNPEPETRVRICVEDNGVGIAPEHHRQVFGIFERIESPHKYEGTGIGLAIVARAVQRMQGRCGVESSPNVGSTFWIELPGPSPVRLP